MFQSRSNGFHQHFSSKNILDLFIPAWYEQHIKPPDLYSINPFAFNTGGFLNPEYKPMGRPAWIRLSGLAISCVWSGGQTTA